MLGPLAIVCEQRSRGGLEDRCLVVLPGERADGGPRSPLAEKR